jgi:hypothetical protein
MVLENLNDKSEIGERAQDNCFCENGTLILRIFTKDSIALMKIRKGLAKNKMPKFNTLLLCYSSIL